MNDVRFKRTKCNCIECPLDGAEKVHGEAGLEKFRVVLIGDGPGAKEEEEGLPFTGAAGAKLKEAVNNSGLIWHGVYKTNLLSCRVRDEKEREEAIECCKPGFEEEMQWAKKQGARAYVPLGQEAMEAFALSGKIQKMRGSVFILDKLNAVAIPTFAPWWILKGMWKEEPTWFGDFVKARDVSLETYKPVREDFNLFPTLADVKKFVDEVTKGKKLIGVDIETTGFNPYFAKILMIGLAVSGEKAIVVPFVKKGGLAYWNGKEEVAVKKEVNRIFKECPLIFQNGMFDIDHLLEKGYKVEGLKHDTMLLHHVINPELPHTLGYIVSIYGKTSYWKDVVLGNEARMINMDDAEVRTYNARDSVVLHQVLPGLLEHLDEVGTRKTYEEVSVPLLMPLLRMTKNGLPLDQKRIAAKKASFTKMAAKARLKCYASANLPEAFNLDSTDQVRYLLWNIKPKGLAKTIAELAAYDDKDAAKKRNKNTKKYRELESKVALYNEVRPFVQVMSKPPKTDSGLPGATDASALISLQRAAINRLDAISDLKNQEKVKEEKGSLEKLMEFLKEFKIYSGADKLASTFSGFPTGPDGRIHPKFKIHGTRTGRLSSAEPNAQNLPEEVLDVFKPNDGRVIIKGDYSNIEYRMMAIMTGESWLIEEFNKGVNFHDINTKLLFSIEKGHPEWDTMRRCAKTFAFGLFYGSTIEGMYRNILAQVPEFRQSLANFKVLVRNYMSKMPNYALWAEKIKKQARETRCVETAFGRKRFLLGTPDEIEREGLNTPIQGSAGEVCNRAIIRLDAELQKKPELKAFLICTVHDSILVEAPEEKQNEVATLMKTCMETEYTINGITTKFPVDIEIGPSWGETAKVEVASCQKKRSTKKSPK